MKEKPKRKYARPISLCQLKLEEALSAFMKVNPKEFKMEIEKKKKKTLTVGKKVKG